MPQPVNCIEGGRLAEGKAPWVSAVCGLHRGDRRKDWMDRWEEAWMAEHRPAGELGPEELRAVYEDARQAREQALAETDDVPSGEYFYLDVVETISEEAVPLPRNVFDADDDVRWIVNREKGVWERLIR